MARDSDNSLPSQKTTDEKIVGPDYVQRHTSFDQNLSRTMPTRTQSEMPMEGDYIEPTPENYYIENPTVPHFMKKNPKWAKHLERNALCRLIGGTGHYYGHKYRSWLMGSAAFISFSCLLLLIIPLISATTSPDLLVGFHWVKGEAHWKLLIPTDWTDKFYLGLGGMTNMTRRGDTYYVKYDAVECTEVFHEACNSCQAASVSVLIYVILSVVFGVLAFFVDIHRIFQFFDYNLSKTLALLLHFAFGLVFNLLAYFTFLQQCFMQLPDYAVHQGDGRKGVGMYLEWHQGIAAQLMVIVVILAPIPGLLHLLVPTPSWANNKGIKKQRAKQRKQFPMMDPFDAIATSVLQQAMEMEPDEKGYARKTVELVDPGCGIPVRHQSSASMKTEDYPAAGRQTSSLSIASTVRAEDRRPSRGEISRDDLSESGTVAAAEVAVPAMTKEDSGDLEGVLPPVPTRAPAGRKGRKARHGRA